jgi:pyruvate,water dikinase
MERHDFRKYIVKGDSVSRGIVYGRVKVIEGLSDVERIEKDDILVTMDMSIDFIPYIRDKVSAIVTDIGNRGSHQAIVAREKGIPCIVATEDATKKLKDGDFVKVDANLGEVYLRNKIY